MKTFKQIRENYRPNQPLYHVTPIDNLYNIITDKKLTPRGNNGIFRRGNFGHDFQLSRMSKGRLHFTNDFEDWLHMFNSYGKTSVVLRISPNHIQKYTFKPTRQASDRGKFSDFELKQAFGGQFGHDMFTTGSVYTKHLEIYNPSTDGWDVLSSVKPPDIHDYETNPEYM